MVMAGSESVSASTTDESLSSRLQWLRQRRETLQEKLAQKNNELKSLCIEEAELTGVLPPEIPLEPGESPPNFRKRVSGTNLNYSQNLINKLKTNGAEESDLELERQVQINIADAALAVLNDASECKAVRRKHRSIYQQSQRKIQDLNAKLNFIRQSHGGVPRHAQTTHIPLHGSQPHLQTTAKHRTKKPRPPLDNSGKDLSPKVESRGFLQDGGISLSPLGPEHGYSSYPSYDLELVGYPGASGAPGQNRPAYHAPSPVDQRRDSVKFVEHANNNVYVPPDQYRGRAYSQGGSSGGGVSPRHFPERVYRPMPNTYTEEERQMHYRQMKLKKENEEAARAQQYPEPRYLDNEEHRKSVYHETDFSGTRYDGQLHEFPVHYNHGKSQQQQPPPVVLRSRDNVDNAMLGQDHKGSKTSIDTYVPPGYWMRLDDEMVWCTDDQMADRFGSLDRRKQGVAHHPSNVDMQSRYHTVAISSKNAVTAHSRPYQLQNPPRQPQSQGPESNNGPPSNRMLLRTQSLGSVETWQQEDPTGSRKPKEKEWYETSLDSSSGGPPQLHQQQQQLPPPQQHPRPMRRGSQHGMPPPAKDRAPVRSNSIPSNRRPREPPQLQEEHQAPRPPIPQSRVLEIPAESKPSLGSQENGNEPAIPLNSPTNHTVVQPGKYQPYREETKPFEMSDFYKYSTKFRKRVEAGTANKQQPQTPTNLNTQNDQNQPNNPMQRIHQPVQRNTCPSYALR